MLKHQQLYDNMQEAFQELFEWIDNVVGYLFNLLICFTIDELTAS
jgi:hypothetical protein